MDDTITKDGTAISHLIYSIIKRFIDIIVGILGILILLPVTIIIKMASVLNKDYAPIFYSHTRIGKNGKEFKLYKFRSMVPNADEVLMEMLKDKKIADEYHKNKKLKNDPRITKVGKIIRKTSLDEIPQFINILKGEMSLVGNRPYLPREKEDMGKYYNDIVKTKPGITGYWQVSGRSELSFEERLDLDLEYYRDVAGVVSELGLVVKTVEKTLKREGAA